MKKNLQYFKLNIINNKTKYCRCTSKTELEVSYKIKV